ncbi:MAG: di-trans,poly-cis-decaprenylcistransferase [Neisseriaceae bacterium]|nr:di-trans,poly-cis-decaprenylcistransferase [Neisseriaceae bacterium]
MTIEQQNTLPRHVAIIMDGNGRWAKKKFLPRFMGHKKGLEAVRKTVAFCQEKGIEFLTLFAFSTENWKRPAEEIHFLMTLFLNALDKEVEKLHAHNLRLRVIGSRANFSADILHRIDLAEQKTIQNTGLTVIIAADYGGRWDITQAVNRLIKEGKTIISENEIAANLVLCDVPEPDLFIRTGGESRISNFLLWQLAYTEFFFSPVLWPDVDEDFLTQAMTSYEQRERRFGLTSEQLPSHQQRSN